MPKENHIKIGNTNLYAQKISTTENKDSPTLIFLHDALGSIAQWKDFPKLLAEKTGLNAIIYDRQGHGKSSPFSRIRTKNYLRDEAIIVLPQFLEKLKIKKPILIGHSDGGTIALLYAANFEPVAIICEAAHIYVEPKTTAGIRQALNKKEDIIERLKKYHWDKSEALFDAWSNTWLDGDFQDWNIENDLNNIDCPALLIQGEKDEYASKNHLEIMVKVIGNKAQSYYIKNGGHNLHRQDPVGMLEVMTNFIKSTLPA